MAQVTITVDTSDAADIEAARRVLESLSRQYGAGDPDMSDTTGVTGDPDMTDTTGLAGDPDMTETTS